MEERREKASEGSRSQPGSTCNVRVPFERTSSKTRKPQSRGAEARQWRDDGTERVEATHTPTHGRRCLALKANQSTRRGMAAEYISSEMGARRGADLLNGVGILLRTVPRVVRVSLCASEVQVDCILWASRTGWAGQ